MTACVLYRLVADLDSQYEEQELIDCRGFDLFRRRFCRDGTTGLLEAPRDIGSCRLVDLGVADIT